MNPSGRKKTTIFFSHWIYLTLFLVLIKNGIQKRKEKKKKLLGQWVEVDQCALEYAMSTFDFRFMWWADIISHMRIVSLKTKIFLINNKGKTVDN